MAANLVECRVENPEGKTAYPYATPLFQNGFTWKLTDNVTILVGENGVGKSTLLESIAARVGFALSGGSKNQTLLYESLSGLVNHYSAFTQDTYQESVARGDKPRAIDSTALSEHLRLVWRVKRAAGFFFRAETYLTMARLPFTVNNEVRASERSHGEGFLQMCGNIRDGLYLLDEPESGLSPVKQLEFLAVIRDKVARYDAQFVLTTHSPILMAYPGAKVFEMTQDALTETDYRETEHFLLTKRVVSNPGEFIEAFFRKMDRG